MEIKNTQYSVKVLTQLTQPKAMHVIFNHRYFLFKRGSTDVILNFPLK